MIKAVDKLFLALSSVMLVLGVGLGSYMGMIDDHSFSQIHGHVNLMGWLSLAMYGMAYRSFPELGTQTTRFVHFMTSAFGAVLFPIGLYFELFEGKEAVVVIASILWLGGALMFAVMAVTLATNESTDDHRPADW
jgi:hypothetical protein